MVSSGQHIGELAGIGTALLWSLSAIAWSHAGRRVGAAAVATIRLTLAVILLAAIHVWLYGSIRPQGSPTALLLLTLSGVLGAGVGDILFFRGLIVLGPRLGMLIHTAAPALSAAVAAVSPMHERLNGIALAGMVLTLTGIAWTLRAEPDKQAWVVPPGQLRAGVLAALAGVMCIAVSYVLTRCALSGYQAEAPTPFAGALVRVAAACACSWALLPLMGRLRSTVRVFRNAPVMGTIAWGTVVGPVIGIWLSLVTFDRVETGVAATLISAGPALFMIPLAYFSHREKPTFHGTAGTLLAVIGVALLMLRHRIGTP